MLGEAALQIEIGRLLTMRAAVKLDAGDFARKEISMAKIVVADALHRAADTGIQLCGARGYSKDTALEWIYRYARQAPNAFSCDSRPRRGKVPFGPSAHLYVPVTESR